MNWWAWWSTENCARNWPYEQMVYAQLKICSREWDAQTPLGFRDANGLPNLDQTTRPYNNNNDKNRTCRIVDFAVPADHRLKLKEIKKKGKYLDLARELKKKKNCGTCMWRLYQLKLVLLVQSPND